MFVVHIRLVSQCCDEDVLSKRRRSLVLAHCLVLQTSGSSSHWSHEGGIKESHIYERSESRHLKPTHTPRAWAGWCGTVATDALQRIQGVSNRHE